MSTQNPLPYPPGIRELTAKEKIRRALALSCVGKKEDAKCQGQIYISVFFDGTGNNIDNDYFNCNASQQKPSNIARLFVTAKDNPRGGYYRFYIPGVGTKFSKIDDAGGAAGAAIAAKGEARILWAMTRLINAPYDYASIGGVLIDDDLAKSISKNAAGIMRKTVFRTWQGKLKDALKNRKPEITQINLSVFGFSRGAAEARAFVNWVYQLCIQDSGGWQFADIPLRTQFLGIFDTVASVGNPQLFPELPFTGHMGWADNNLIIHPAVEQCVHYVAGHEVRACFPLDSVREGNRYPGNVIEVMYPGAHSDIGGGYVTGDLGINSQQNEQLCVIPGRRMYDAAMQAGVPLKSLTELPLNVKKLITPANSVINAFNSYIKSASIEPGPVEKMHEQHMSLYLSYRFKYRGKFFETLPCKAASASDKKYLKTTQSSIINGLRKLNAGDPMANDFDPIKAASQYSPLPSLPKAKSFSMPPPASRLAKVKREKIDCGKFPEFHPAKVASTMDLKRLTLPIEEFLGKYVHDSVAGFIGMGMNEYYLNDIGLFKFRHTFKGDE